MSWHCTERTTPSIAAPIAAYCVARSAAAIKACCWRASKACRLATTSEISAGSSFSCLPRRSLALASADCTLPSSRVQASSTPAPLFCMASDSGLTSAVRSPKSVPLLPAARFQSASAYTSSRTPPPCRAGRRTPAGYGANGRRPPSEPGRPPRSGDPDLWNIPESRQALPKRAALFSRNQFRQRRHARRNPGGAAAEFHEFSAHRQKILLRRTVEIFQVPNDLFEGCLPSPSVTGPAAGGVISAGSPPGVSTNPALPPGSSAGSAWFS